jgi:hypothetical protein
VVVAYLQPVALIQNIHRYRSEKAEGFMDPRRVKKERFGRNSVENPSTNAIESLTEHVLSADR